MHAHDGHGFLFESWKVLLRAKVPKPLLQSRLLYDHLVAWEQIFGTKQAMAFARDLKILVRRFPVPLDRV
eukprot:scaffold1475_cov167-Amphora_coffeaeformis.AAC.10